MNVSIKGKVMQGRNDINVKEDRKGQRKKIVGQGIVKVEAL